MSFDEAWLEAAVTASSSREPTGLHGSAELLIGKTTVATVAVDDGRILGAASGTPECQLPFSKTQAEDFLAGELKLSVAYMRGDVKPTGSTAAIMAVIDALDALNS